MASTSATSKASSMPRNVNQSTLRYGSPTVDANNKVIFKEEPCDDGHNVLDNSVGVGNVSHLGDGHETLQQSSIPTIHQNGSVSSVIEQNEGSIASFVSNVDTSVHATIQQSNKIKEEPCDDGLNVLNNSVRADDVSYSEDGHNAFEQSSSYTVQTSGPSTVIEPNEDSIAPSVSNVDSSAHVTIQQSNQHNTVPIDDSNIDNAAQNSVPPMLLNPTQHIPGILRATIELDFNPKCFCSKCIKIGPSLKNISKVSAYQLYTREFLNGVGGDEQPQIPLLIVKYTDWPNEGIHTEHLPNAAGNEQLHLHTDNRVETEVTVNEVAHSEPPLSESGDDELLQPQIHNQMATEVANEVAQQSPSQPITTKAQQNDKPTKHSTSPSHDDNVEGETSSQKQLRSISPKDGVQVDSILQTLNKQSRLITKSATKNFKTVRMPEIDIEPREGPSGQTSNLAKTRRKMYNCGCKRYSNKSLRKVRNHIKKKHFGVKKSILNFSDEDEEEEDDGEVNNSKRPRLNDTIQQEDLNVNLETLRIEPSAGTSKQSANNVKSPTMSPESVTNLGRSDRDANPMDTYAYETESETEENDINRQLDLSEYDDEEEDEQEVISRSDKQTRKSSPNTLSKQFIIHALQCPHCPNMYEKDKFAKHMKNEHQILKHQCVVKDCGKSFNKWNELRDHKLKIHHGTTQWNCDKCPRNFESYVKLHNHTIGIHYLGHFECAIPTCKYTGEYRVNMWNHYTNSHTQKEFLNCPEPDCNYQTQMMNSLKVHLRSHTGIRPYRCKWPKCHKSFATQSNIIKHIRETHFKIRSNAVKPGTQLCDVKKYIEVEKKLLR